MLCYRLFPLFTELLQRTSRRCIRTERRGLPFVHTVKICPSGGQQAMLFRKRFKIFCILLARAAVPNLNSVNFFTRNELL